MAGGWWLACDFELGGFVIGDQALGDFIGDIGARAHEFSAQALGGCRPDHVSVLTHQPDGGDSLVLALLVAAAVVFTDGESAGVAATGIGIISQALTAAGSNLRVRVDAFRRLESVGEYIVVAGAFEGRIGLFFVFCDHELLGIVQAGHQKIAQLQSGIAAGEDGDVNPADLAQVLGGFLFWRLVREGRKQ